ncbi:MAG TPA: EAL domain-containing protein [Kofleriaceae bacterium]
MLRALANVPTDDVGEERYRSLFDRSPLPMWMIDRDTLRFVMVNDAAVECYGYSKESFATMTLADIEPADQPVGPRKVSRHRKQNGTNLFVEIRANDFVSEGRNVRLAVVYDVTERLRAEQVLRETEDQLRHAQKMEAVGRLAGGVAHDFNNVLTVVQTYACMLEASLDPSDMRHDDASEIRRASERATAITRQLLTLSRQSAVAPKAIEPDALVAGFLPMLRRLVGEAVTIVTRCGQVPRVIADPGQIEQVLMNLALNARDAMADGGRLTIATQTVELDAETAGTRRLEAGRYVELAVTDTGSGIDAETQKRIFDPFFTTKGAEKGTGLGLSIVHGIVTQAGGSITVYSEPGHGSTFRIHLPVAHGDATATEAPQPVAPKTLPAMRVLVVDDQNDVRAAACRVLREAGCQVLEAATADEARRICVREDDAIDVVLLDVALPDGRGDTLLRQLRELRPSLRAVQMSGYPATATGAITDLLSKPFSPSELRGAIARACGVRAEAPAVQPAGALRRALVADDDAEMRKVAVRLLRKSGFEVVAVESGFRAITALESQPFDVVVSDVHMPDGGGLDLLRAIRRVDLDVPVILISGEPSVAAAASAVEYGAFRYLTKPLENASFVKTVEHAARAHALARLRREAYHVSGAHGGAVDRAGLEVRFDGALDSMWMAYQPIVHADTGALFGVEALVRTNEPSLPHPHAFLDAATQLGRLPLVGRKIRARAAEMIAARTDGVALFVNLHPDDLLDVDLLDLGSPLAKIAKRVILEVTERASLDTSPALNERIARLRQLGFRLAVDDIGAGYSGLTSFTQLMPEVVKIDMSLVRDVHKSVLKQRTIGALCRLCRDVGTLVVGEGVETLEEREALVALGCDLLQGYLLGRPSREP